MLKIIETTKKRPNLIKIIKNISWLSFDKFFRLIVSLLVGILVVRYLGPTDFGLMNLATAFVALFSPFVGLGLLPILRRELIIGKFDENKLMGSVFFIYLITSFIILIFVNIVFLIIRPNDYQALMITFIFSITYILQSLNLLIDYFESRIESKKTVIAGTIALIISNLAKIIFIIFNLPLEYIVIASVIDTFISVSIMLIFYLKSGKNPFSWKFDFFLIKILLKDSWPLVVSGVMVVIYLKIDQVMIGILLNDFQLGLYSVAVKLSEFFFFVPAIIMTSLFPSFVKSKSISKEVYDSRLQKLFDFFTWISIIIIIPIIILSNFIVVFLYGNEYLLAGSALAISIVSLLAVSIRFIIEKYLITENKTKIVFFNALIGAVSNVLLNLILIPIYGINGAAIATVISYTLASYFGLLIFKSTRRILFMMINSFNLIRVFADFKRFL